MGQRAAQVAQAVGLAHQVGVERDAHDQRLGGGLLQHLVEIVDDHVGELRRPVLARDDGGDVVDLLRVGDGQEPPVFGAHPHRLVVHRPVERVAVAVAGEQVGGDAAFGDPGREPALGRRPLRRRDDGGGFGDQGGFGLRVQHALAFGIGAAVAHHLVAAGAEGGHELRRVGIHGAVGEHADGQAQPLEHLEHAPGAHPVAVVAPGVVEDVGRGAAGGKLGPQPLAEGEMLQVQPEIDGEPLAPGPGIIGPPGDGRIVVAAMAGQAAQSGASARPALWSRISALSFQTSVLTITPSRTTNLSM